MVTDTTDDSLMREALKLFTKKKTNPDYLQNPEVSQTLHHLSQRCKKNLKYIVTADPENKKNCTVKLFIGGHEKCEIYGINTNKEIKLIKLKVAKSYVDFLLEDSNSKDKNTDSNTIGTEKSLDEAVKTLNNSNNLKEGKNKVLRKVDSNSNKTPAGFFPEKDPKSDIASWTSCVELIDNNSDESVKNLKIFALNTSTLQPMYQINEVNDGGNLYQYQVFCSWNQFILNGEGSTKNEAENVAAWNMLNRIRKLCGLSVVELSEKKESVQEEENMTPGKLSENIELGCGRHRDLLTGQGNDKIRLSELAHRLGAPEPIYEIIGVENVRWIVTVTVKCTWDNLTTKASGTSKTKAEESAAELVLKDVLKQVGSHAQCPELESPAPDLVTRTEVKQTPVLRLKETADELSVTFSKVVPGDQEQEEESPGDDIKYCAYPLGGVASVTVTSRDYLCLQSEQFLNDVIIDFYLRYLQAGMFSKDLVMQEKTHIFSIYFYNRLTMKPKSKKISPSQTPAILAHENVKKWSKNIDIFSKDFVVIPINDLDHWYVVIICFPGLSSKVVDPKGRVKQPVILILDSLEDGQKDSVCQVLRDYLTVEWSEKRKSQPARSFNSMRSFCPSIPQQQNLTDCGLYLLQYVESFFQNPIQNFSIPLKSLISWYTSEDVDTKREKIARLIRDLSREQNPGVKLKFPDIGFKMEELMVVRNKSDQKKLQEAGDSKIKISLKTKSIKSFGKDENNSLKKVAEAYGDIDNNEEPVVKKVKLSEISKTSR